MNTIFKGILEIVQKSDQSDKDKLAQTMEDYAQKYYRSYRGLKSISSSFCEFFDSLEEIVDARIENRY